MTVVLETRDDFTLLNFRRVCYDGEAVRLGEQARRALSAPGWGRAAQGEASARAVAAPAGSGSGSVGGYLDEAVVRGILFARLGGWVSGYTAVRLTAAERVAALLDGPAPRVPSGGPAGPDEAAVMAAVLAGVGRDDLGEAEQRALAEPAPCAAALAADTALRSRHRLESAQAICALSIEAFGAPLGAYDAALDDLWGDAHEAAALRGLRRHLDGAGTDGRRFHQAPVSYRIIPRVLGQAHRAVAAVEKAAATALRAVTGDVLVAGRVLPNGGFHNGMAYPAMNELSATWADLALVAERQITALNTAETSGLPLNLAVAEAAPTGTYGYGWAASSFVEEARAAAVPTLLPAAAGDPRSDVFSPAFSAHRRERRAAECLDGVLAILMIVSSQALFVTGRSPAGPLRPLLSFARSMFPPIDGTGVRDLSADGRLLQQALAEAAVSGRLIPGPGGNEDEGG
ncbi:aromatic amino acid lyase [[Mycobacterium] nativiensis]|uniref:Aromatic amino acid lyase n=1 Tax=[Mycobacterium] nativiensis TaxID=2855503 RepID=A0ABU5Y160_9MYCO|nr:aromatic amino acid lyase [Mycolicibacter sp. MYC340]MEB3033868.1 aromatic amino acid lyase [Mycolicibacter sp. MYC340]